MANTSRASELARPSSPWNAVTLTTSLEETIKIPDAPAACAFAAFSRTVQSSGPTTTTKGAPARVSAANGEQPLVSCRCPTSPPAVADALPPKAPGGKNATNSGVASGSASEQATKRPAYVPDKENGE
eukprot:CAMPEP_0204168644 /NCGR_PEP_ID=MMETSP0361-20130328/40903_2 /ASSEMBLY_ACC=CAM_ASM_000343 /TAXON_ID=268821 /ORGANISM="Scrippsiella Hangoei, Strain SHTV-5" /LENGTH=127 /DNA_ID=CAMNT_0051126119 /DNA_START=166 /DNA_END=549 /DNA_ORIENTATION=-